MFYHHLKTAFRLFARNKIIFSINLLGMSIAFASMIIIGNWIYNEFRFDGFHEKKDRIYRLYEKQAFNGQNIQYLSSMPEWLTGTFEKEIPGIEASTGLFNVGNLWFGDKNHRVEGKNVTFTNNNIFKIFTFNIIDGDATEALTRPEHIVISESLAERYFEETMVAGKTINYQDEYELVVAGVFEDIPDNSHFQSEAFVSMEVRKPTWDMEDYNHTTSIYLLLDENTKAESLQEALQKHKNKYMPHDAAHVQLNIQPLSDVHLYSRHTIWGQNYKKSDIKLINMFLTIGILVMIISCINYINLSNASVTKRFREFGLKKVVGSGRVTLIIQFLFESFMVLFIAFWLSLLLIEGANPVLIKHDILEQSEFIYREVWFFPLMMVIVLLLSIASGIYPALVLTSVKPILLFKSNFIKNSQGLIMKRILVITQLSITCVLIISVIFISNQINYMKNKELGYSRKAIINIWASEPIRENYETIKSELIKHESIKNITSANIPLGNSMWRNGIDFEGKPADENWVTPYMMVDHNFVKFYHLKIIEGRGFDETNSLDRNEQAFLVNETLAKKIGGDQIIGKPFRIMNSKWGEVVGIIQDFNYRSLHHHIEPLAIRLGLNYNNLISIEANAADIPGTIKVLEQSWKQYQPDEPFKFSFLDQNLDNLYRSEERTSRIELIFCIISIVLSCIGLLGMYIYITEGKTKEIGVRKVNGASSYCILKLLSRELVLNVLVALFISVPVGGMVARSWVQNFAYQANVSWWIFLIAGGTVFLLAWFTISIITIRASRRNPVDALRYE